MWEAELRPRSFTHRTVGRHDAAKYVVEKTGLALGPDNHARVRAKADELLRAHER